jgi:hypothetical protein|tara:strand:- start:191 stop:454 length:264 start_codon:yes stop_codon:yes gene_type:complete
MPTWEDLVDRAGKYITKLLDQHENAPTFGAYNKLIGKKSTSKRDVTQDCMANLKLVNEISQMLYKSDVISFEDDVRMPKATINTDKP